MYTIGMDAAIIIPARLASTRLPAKPLLRETGKYLIQHVYEQALRVRNVSQVIVATDAEEIVQAVRSFGGTAVMTSDQHPSGTDRVAEVAATLDVPIIINLQGDEPGIEPEYLELLAELLREEPSAQMATLAVPFQNLADFQNPNAVKVVLGEKNRALYFSRASIPFVRDGQPDFSARPARFLHHLGLYAYRRESLLQLAQMPPHPLEQLEKLEQLRALATGWFMRVGVVPSAGKGVDTPEDYARFVAEYRNSVQRNRQVAQD
ncbi:MAG: 3-deoxy-manno-octulosonate cytidylyltransferase [Gemmataceae bacterium]|nr:3-deoxy-manno-octulosonate cytidylyltransferase [Gemmataceae bacterium]